MLHAHENGIGAGLMPTEGRGRDRPLARCQATDLPPCLLCNAARCQEAAAQAYARASFGPSLVNRCHYRDAHNPCARSVLDQVDGREVNLSPHGCAVGCRVVAWELLSAARTRMSAQMSAPSVCALIVCTHLARSQSREIASRTDWSVPSSWQPLGRLPSSNPSGLPSYSHRRPDSYTTDLPVENNDEASTYAECAGERCLSRCTASRGKYKKAWESLDAAVVASVHILVTVNVTY